MKINLKQVGIKDKITEISVNNMISSTGKNVPNQYNIFIYCEDGVYNCFYSYDSLIMVLKNGNIVKVGKDYNYSSTTGKYRNKFINMNLKELDTYIKNNMSYNCDSECWELKSE